MHSNIGIITFSLSSDAAHSQSEAVVENMTGESMPFDYGTMITTPVLTSGEKGKKLLDDFLEFTKKEFLILMKDIRQGLSLFTDEEFLEHDYLVKTFKEKECISYSTGMIRHYMGVAGKYKGLGVYLYDNDGEGILTKSHLDRVLNKWDSKEYDKMGIYITVFDVHS